MSYIDGFVIPVPAYTKDVYRKMAEEAAVVFREYGAARIVACWGDDVPDGKVTDFKRAVNAEAGENVVFSSNVWQSPTVRDEAPPKIMDAPPLQPWPDMTPTA